MRVRVGTNVTQWLLLCVVLLGVVGMHHMATGHTPEQHHHATSQHSAGDIGSLTDRPAQPVAVTTAMTSVDGGCCVDHARDATMPAPTHPAGGHNLLHLCMAVIAAGAVLLLMLLEAGARRTTSAAALTTSILDAWFTVTDPPPRPHGRRLVLVAVLRQ